MRVIICALTIFLMPVVALSAESVKISEKLSVEYSIPEGWVRADEPPEKLVAIMAEHIGHEAEEKGQSPSEEQLLKAASKRLSANEVLLFNPETLAHMSIDFSSLRQGEKAPSRKSIQLSAKYAGESLEQEEGVSNLKGQSRNAEITGAWYAHLYEANYLHHDEQMFFSGTIGYAEPYWFYFYYSDYLKDPADRDKAEQLLKTLKIISN